MVKVLRCIFSYICTYLKSIESFFKWLYTGTMIYLTYEESSRIESLAINHDDGKAPHINMLSTLKTVFHEIRNLLTGRSPHKCYIFGNIEKCLELTIDLHIVSYIKC